MQERSEGSMLALLDNDQYAPSLKVLLESGKARELLDFLEQFVRGRTMYIQQVCGSFSEVFGDFDELASLEQDAAHAKDRLEHLAVACASAEKSIRRDSRAVARRFSLLHNRDVALRALDASLALLADVERLQRLVRDKSTLAEALCLLDKIQRTYVAPHAARVAFVRHVADQLPEAEAALVRGVNARVKAWLTLAWEACPAVGAGELANARALLARRADIARDTRVFLTTTTTTDTRTKARTNAPADTTDAGSSTSGSSGSARVRVESYQLFTAADTAEAQQKEKQQARAGTHERLAKGLDALAEAVFVAQKLGVLGAVAEDYYETKNMQIPKLFQHTARDEQARTPRTTARERFQCTLETVAGYFAIETDVSQVFEDLLPAQQLQDLWRAAIAPCKQLLVNEFAAVDAREDFLAVLKAVLALTATTGMHCFDTQPLLECVSTTAAERCCEMEFQSITAALDQAHATNTWAPMKMRTGAELQAKALDHALPHNGLAAPFSPLVPLFFELLKTSIGNLFALEPYFGDNERQVTKHADVCFQHFIRLLTTLPPSVASPPTAPEPEAAAAAKTKVAVQQLADLCALKDAPAHLEQYLARRCVFGHTPRLDVSKTMLEAAVNDTLAGCKKLLGQALTAALDRFQAGWAAAFAAAPRRIVVGTSAPVPDAAAMKQLCRCLTATEALLAQLPPEHASQLRAQLYPGVPAAIVGVPKSAKKLRYGSLLALAADVRTLGDVLRSVPDRQSVDPLRQLDCACQVLLHPDEARVAAYCSSQDCPLRLQSAAAVAGLLEKVKEDSQAPRGHAEHTKACLSALAQAAKRGPQAATPRR